MRIKYGSDFHTEYGEFSPACGPNEQSSVLVLAGDIGRRFNFKEMVERFAHVVFVPGNHDYYGMSIEEADTGFFTDLEKQFSNFHFLQEKCKIIEDVRFLGCTMWSDLSNYNPILAINLGQKGSDFSKILNANRDDYISVEDMFEINRRHQRWLRESIAAPFDGKTVIVTHFPPDPMCRDSSFREDCFTHYMTNGNLQDLIADPSWDLWLYGHVHEKRAIELTSESGKKQILGCNARGYPHREDVTKYFLEEIDL